MVEIFDEKREYWSKSKWCLLPLTDIPKTKDFDITTYVKWKNYTIENFQLIVKVEYGSKYSQFQEFFAKIVENNKAAFAIEAYDYEGFTIVIYDLSYWAKDIRFFIKGQYSKLSESAKRKIEAYHTFYKNGKYNINIRNYICLHPDEPQAVLGNMTPIDYAALHYNMDLTEIAQVCSICEPKKETLVLLDCQVDIPIKLE